MKTLTEKWELKMIEEMKVALNEKGYEYKVTTDGTLMVNPNERNGLMFYIEIFDEKGYLFVPNIMKIGDPKIRNNYKGKSWTPSTPAEVIEFMEWAYEQYPDWVEDIEYRVEMQNKYKNK
ncbi:hypothetical protein COD90_07920 [Bacillus cereus]|nr:hypothetical protein COD90_07920 [Bacillus cereus]